MAQRSYQLGTIPDGVQGTAATLNIMRGMIRTYRKAPAIRELALHLTKDLPPKSWRAQAARIHRFVRDHIRYTKDIRGCETLQTPIQTLKIGQGDCDDKTTLAASLLEAIGHPTKIVAVGMSPGIYQHVFPETKIGGKWVAVETTEMWPLGRGPKNVKAKMERYT